MVQFLLFIFFRDWKNTVFGVVAAFAIGFLWQRAEIIEYGVAKQFWFHDILFAIIVISITINFVTISYIHSLLVRGRELNKDKKD